MKRAELHGWHIYVVYELEGPYTKIGTAGTVAYRVASLRDGNPRKLEIYKSWRLSSRENAFKVERAALARAEAKRVPGRDWVLLSHNLAAKLVEGAATELEITMEEIV